MARRAFALETLARTYSSLAATIGVGLVLAAAVVAGLAPWAFSSLALRAEIAARIRDMTGLETVAQGTPVFAFLPRPHVGIDDVTFADPSGALRVRTRRLEGYLRVASLLVGRIEVTRVRLGRPELYIDTEGRPMPPHSAIGRAATAKSATPQASSTDQARLGAVELVDGTARIVNGTGGQEVLIEAINVVVDWPKVGNAARVDGHLGWNGETAAIDATIDRPVELIRGEPSGLDLRISAPAGKVAFDGLLESTPIARLSGRLTISAPSAPKLLALAGSSHLRAPFDALALSCDATISQLEAACTGLGLRIDDNELVGTLTLRAQGDRTALSGKLATSALSLHRVLASLPAAMGGDGQWSRAAFTLRPERVPDLDLRLAAARVEIGGLALVDTELSLRSGEGRIEVALPTAKASGGAVTGRAVLAVSDGEVGLRVQTTFEEIGLSTATRGSLGTWRIGGATTGSATLESKGSSMSELVRNLKGSVALALASGEFAGIDLDRAFRRLDRRPLSLSEEIHRGATAFESASFILDIGRGVAAVETGRLRTPAVDLSFGGTADLAERSLNLHAVATPGAAAQGTLAHENRKFRFDVAGSFDDPLFLPDVRSLIRRSGAAAPLLGRSPEAPAR